MSVVGRRVKVRVPATTANLGPGFDTLGLALAFFLEEIGKMNGRATGFATHVHPLFDQPDHVVG